MSRGEEWFHRALRDPDSLAEYPANLWSAGVLFEEFAYVASRIHEKRTGDVPPPDESPALTPRSKEPSGVGWEGDAETLRSRWPKLFAKYRQA